MCHDEITAVGTTGVCHSVHGTALVSNTAGPVEQLGAWSEWHFNAATSCPWKTGFPLGQEWTTSLAALECLQMHILTLYNGEKCPNSGFHREDRVLECLRR